jgi:hypothetical protein
MFGDFIDEEIDEKKVETKPEKTAVVEVETEESETIENTVENQEEEQVEETPYQILLGALVEKGIVQIDEDKEYSPTEEGFVEVIQDTVQKTLDNAFAENEQLALLYDVVQKGGSIQDIVEFYKEVNYEELDMTDADTQEAVLIDYYTAKGLSEAKIDKLIKNAKDDGSFAEEVTEAHNALVATQKKQVQDYLKSLETQNQEAEENARESLAALRGLINKQEEIQGFKLDKKTKDEFYSYMTKPVKSGKTQLQLDSEDKEKQLKMAFMYFNNFNIKDIKTQSTTSLTEKLNKALKSQKDLNTKTSSSSGASRKPIDDFDDIII